MVRTLFTMPGPVAWSRLETELVAVVPDIQGCNQVGDFVAVYTNSAITDETVAAEIVAAHTGPPQWPALDAVGALATLLAVDEVITVADAANAIHEEPAHLEAEAMAWSLGGM